MSEQNSGQIIQVPNTLRLKVGAAGGRLAALDPSAIAKAEAALKSLSGNFVQWLNDEVTKLEAARQVIRTDGLTPQTLESRNAPGRWDWESWPLVKPAERSAATPPRRRAQR